MYTKSASSYADAPHALPSSGSSSKACISRNKVAPWPSAGLTDADQVAAAAPVAVEQLSIRISSSSSDNSSNSSSPASPFIKACWQPFAADSSSSSGSSISLHRLEGLSGSLGRLGIYANGRYSSSSSSSSWADELDISSSDSSCSSSRCDSWTGVHVLSGSNHNDSSDCWLNRMVSSSSEKSLCELGISFTAGKYALRQRTYHKCT